MSTPANKKRKRSGQQKAKSSTGQDEAAVESYLNLNPPAKCEVSHTTCRWGVLVNWGSMSVNETPGQTIPDDGAPEEEWVARGWVPYVTAGKKNSIWLPVYSEEKTPDEFRAMEDWQKERSVPSKSGDVYFYCPRNHVDKVVQGVVHSGHYLANAVRFCHDGEQPNCRVMLDWDRTEEEGGDQCILVSILKTQTPSEWKLDREHARRRIGLVESDDESEAGVAEPVQDFRSLRNAREAKEDEAEAEYRNRVVGSLESCTMHLGGLDHIQNSIEHQISVTTKLRADYRQGNGEVGLRLGKCLVLLERIAAALERSPEQAAEPATSKPVVLAPMEGEPSPDYSPYSPSK